MQNSFNKMKDYAAVAGQLGVTHIIAFSQTKSNVVLRLGRHPEGPTLHFKVLKYSLSRQVRALQKRPYECPGACTSTRCFYITLYMQLFMKFSLK
jgi:ribosome biogenesis protein SSF1/2